MVQLVAKICLSVVMMSSLIRWLEKLDIIQSKSGLFGLRVTPVRSLSGKRRYHKTIRVSVKVILMIIDIVERVPMSVQVLPSALDLRRLVPSKFVHKQER